MGSPRSTGSILEGVALDRNFTGRNFGPGFSPSPKGGG
jgi:hypothetical protein